MWGLFAPKLPLHHTLFQNHTWNQHSLHNWNRSCFAIEIEVRKLLRITQQPMARNNEMSSSTRTAKTSSWPKKSMREWPKPGIRSANLVISILQQIENSFVELFRIDSSSISLFNAYKLSAVASQQITPNLKEVGAEIYITTARRGPKHSANCDWNPTKQRYIKKTAIISPKRKWKKHWDRSKALRLQTFTVLQQKRSSFIEFFSSAMQFSQFFTLQFE